MKAGSAVSANARPTMPGRGSPAAGASVSLLAADLDDFGGSVRPPVMRTTGPDGRFAYAGLSDGTYEIRAEQNRAQSAPQLVAISGARVGARLKLVLDVKETTLRGWVTSAAGDPLPGIVGLAFAETADPAFIPGVAQFSTDMLGFFRIGLDRRPDGWVQVAVLARGRPLTAFRVPFDGSGDGITLKTAALGGECRLILPRSDDTPNGLPADSNLFVLVNDKGAVLSLPQLFNLQAATITPTRDATLVVIPSLSAGIWRVGKVPSLRAGSALWAGAGAPSTFTTFTVTPGTRAQVLVK